MKVAIWDTYVKRADGSVIHIDIVVPDTVKSETTIYNYGKTYLTSINESGEIDANHCQFCHIEEPSKEMIDDINQQGFSIIRMEDIPKDLPVNPNRRDLILYLRAHSNQFRFSNFRNIQDAELLKMTQTA